MPSWISYADCAKFGKSFQNSKIKIEDEHAKQSKLIEDEFLSSIKELEIHHIFALGRILDFPEIKCLICKEKPSLPHMLKTDCEHLQIICQDCTPRLYTDFSHLNRCLVCNKQCTINQYSKKYVLEFQDLLCKFNDWSIDTQGVGFLDATCRKCNVNFIYQNDIITHYRQENCSGQPRTTSLYDKSEEFDVKCVVCLRKPQLPTKFITVCNCKSNIACFSCICSVLTYGYNILQRTSTCLSYTSYLQDSETKCMECQSPMIAHNSISLIYTKQRGFQLLDDWFKKHGKKHYCNSTCPHCGIDFGFQFGLFKHMISRSCPKK